MLAGGLDVGTTGCKLTVYNDLGEFVCKEYREYNIIRENGEHEIDAEIIFKAVCDVIKETVKKEPELDGIGITTFGETFVMLDEKDKPLLPSMLYTDSRGYEEVEELKCLIPEEEIIRISGVKPHAMYALPKMMWIKKNLSEVYKKCRHIMLMEDYIVYMLTGKAKIDYSLAARTMALDIREKSWSKKILDVSGIDINKLSEIVPTGTVAGSLKKELMKEFGIQSDLKIINAAHDQVASAVGAGVFEVNHAVDGAGTVECLTPVFDRIPENRELYDKGYCVVPYVTDGMYLCYAFSFTGGAVLKWHRDNFAKAEAEESLKIGRNVYSELDKRISDKPTGIMVLPHFAGAATPYMDSGSKAVMLGLTLEHTSDDIYKALMEGVAYELMINAKNLEKYGIKLSEFYATGGGASSSVWLQIKADILNRPITALDAPEAGACGTCILVMKALGKYKTLKEAKKFFVKVRKTYMPDEEKHKIYNKYYNAYKKIYGSIRPVLKEAYDE